MRILVRDERRVADITLLNAYGQETTLAFMAADGAFGEDEIDQCCFNEHRVYGTAYATTGAVAAYWEDVVQAEQRLQNFIERLCVRVDRLEVMDFVDTIQDYDYTKRAERMTRLLIERFGAD